MRSEEVSWLADELGFPQLEESAAGLRANPAARSSLRDDELPRAIEHAAASIASTVPSDSNLASLLARARAGERCSELVGGHGVSAHAWRVLASPAEPGYARLTFAPASLAQSGAVQRRAALVDVAAAVSHEVANAMSAITGWADLASRPDESGIDPVEALALIGSCARTAQGAARRMLSLARGHDSQEEATDFSELAQEVVDLLTPSARQARVTLTGRIENDLVVRGARGQLFTVLWNLAKNAIEACPAAGRVEICAQGDAGEVQISVRDTGPGLDDAERERIFSPYYTTKAGGTGLGLPLVRQTVESLAGELTVRSVVGHGTTFQVSLPRSIRRSATIMGTSGTSDAPPVRMQSEEAPRGSQILDADILVIDDDDALREMLATALSLKGARVTAVSSSAQARALTGRFDIALIDMMLADCRGDELLAALRVRGTVNAAMLVTGTVQKPRLVPGGEPDDWVRKPFEISQLVDRLKRTLERHAMLSAATAAMRL